MMLKGEYERPDTKTLGEEVEAIKVELEELASKKQKLPDVVEGGVFTLADVRERVYKIGQEPGCFARKSQPGQSHHQKPFGCASTSLRQEKHA
jgi:hypothetical protein